MSEVLPFPPGSGVSDGGATLSPQFRKNGAPTVFCPNAELFYQTRLALVLKERLKQDKDAQALEDEACIVFLAHYLADFAEKHDSNKVVEILRKTWAKMSPLGHRAALALPLGGALKELLASASGDGAAGDRTVVQP